MLFLISFNVFFPLYTTNLFIPAFFPLLERFVDSFDRAPDYELLLKLVVADRIKVVSSNIVAVSDHYYQFSAAELELMWNIFHRDSTLKAYNEVVASNAISISKWMKISITIKYYAHFVFFCSFVTQKYTRMHTIK